MSDASVEISFRADLSDLESGAADAVALIRRAADAIARLAEESSLRQISIAQDRNDFLLRMGDESLDEWKANATAEENAKLAAELSFLEKKAALDRTDAAAQARDLEQRRVLYETHALALQKIDEQVAERKGAIDQQDLQEFLSADAAKLADGLKTLDAEFREHKITADQRYALEQNLTATIYTEEIARLNALIATLTAGTKAYEDAIKQRQKLEQDFTKQSEANTNQLETYEAQKWTTLGNSIKSSFNSAMDGMLFQGKSFEQGMLTIAEGVVYTGLQLQTSAQGVPVTLMWGKARFAPNIFWYNNFQQHKQGAKGAGGKGGGKAAGNYTYTAAVMLGLCEGPIDHIEAVWADQTQYANGTGLAKLGLTLFTGTASQAVWSYLTTNYPSQAIPYESLAYVANSNYKLGASAALPNHNFEVAGPLAYSAPEWGEGDANPADIVKDFLTNPQYSIGLNTAQIDATSLAFYRTYCAAQCLNLSPVLDTQEQISQTLDRWASLTNTWIFWSAGVLKFVPLGDSPVTRGGTTYTPYLVVQYALTYDDLIATKVKQGSSSGDGASKTGDGGPIQVTRSDPADAPNHVKIEIKDRGNAYNAAPVEWQDQALVDQFGQIDASVTTAHEVCNLGIAAIVAQLIGQRAAYIRNTYAFKLGYEFSLLEPGDIVSLTDPHIGLAAFPVRIRSIDEDESGTLAVIAEEFPGGIGTAP